jgi:hypothetical protein
MKPIVSYTELYFCEEGSSAIVKPVDHPSPLVTNRKPVLTSPVIQYDRTTGEFETFNTIYRPVAAVH